jgi:N,N'-diacetyllegionaminate synthase
MDNEQTIIIAEAGVNHNGKLRYAIKLIDIALEAGADIIKFQTFKTEKLVLKSTKKAKYQVKNTKSNNTQYSMLKKLEMSDAMHQKIINYCNEKKIEFLSTAFNIEELDYLVNLGIKRIKIPSGEITNLPYLEKVASFGLPIIVSTGMSTLTEVCNAYEVLSKAGVNNNSMTFLHCTSNYPTKLNAVNLRAMKLIKDKLNVNIGYSDHTTENETSIAAVSLGAEIIEKHITLDCKMTGPDHKASIEPPKFKKLVQSIRKVEQLLGNEEKIPNTTEIENALLVRKSIVSSCSIKKGDKFTSENITTKRPGLGLSPMLWHKIIGTKSKKIYMKDQLIDYEN